MGPLDTMLERGVGAVLFALFAYLAGAQVAGALRPHDSSQRAAVFAVASICLALSSIGASMVFGWKLRSVRRRAKPDDRSLIGDNAPAKPTAAACEEARRCPNGYVYEIDVDGNIVVDGKGDAPPHTIKGVWTVGASGKIVGEFVPNPNYQPSAS
jgi:hypothetical protein